ncbi:MAG TPA: hypothetical protein VNX28_04860 [Gemmataceae bacterium]|nr:hypothetical protein [Gemmataceae bacterium]
MLRPSKNDMGQRVSNEVPHSFREKVLRARDGAFHVVEQVSRLLRSATDNPCALLWAVPDFVFQCFFRNGLFPYWVWAVNEVEPHLTVCRKAGVWKVSVGTWPNAHAGAWGISSKIYYSMYRIESPMDQSPHFSDIWERIAGLLPQPNEIWTKEILRPVPLAISRLSILLELEEMHREIASACFDDPAQEAGRQEKLQEATRRIKEVTVTEAEESDFLLKMKADSVLCTVIRAANTWNWPELGKRLQDQLHGFDTEAWTAEIKWESSQVLAHVRDTPQTTAGGETGGQPVDHNVFRPAKEFLMAPYDTYRAINAVLDENPWIGKRRPRHNRLEIHAGDWIKFLAATKPADPLDALAETVDAVMETKARQDKIREKN